MRFTPEQEARLQRIADHNGAAVEDLVRGAVLRLIAEDDEFRSAVRTGVAAADRGEFIEEDAMEERIRKMLQS